MSVYQSGAWKSLDKINRAQLLLVIEGLKRGTMTQGSHAFEAIARKNGLGCEVITDPYELHPMVMVARPEDLQEASRRFLFLPENGQYNPDQTIGWLFGYPRCCTEEYVKGMTPAQKRAIKEGRRYLSYRFGQELAEQISTKGSYPDFLDYRPPGFLPCSLSCEESKKSIGQWKEAIETHDPEAARELVYLNRSHYPQNLVHPVYLWQENEKRALERRLKTLRDSFA